MDNFHSDKTESGLNESEKYFRLISENANDLIRVLDSTLKIEYINESSHIRSIGYTNNDLIGENALMLIHPEEYLPTRIFLKKILKTGDGTREGRIRHQNGEWVWFEIKGRRFTDESGNIKILFISRDISERKRAEEKLKERNEIFRTLSTAAQDAIIQIDDNDQILFWNKASEKIFQYSQEEIIGKKFHALFIPERNHKAFERGFEQFKKSGKGNIIGKTRELIGLRKDDIEIPLEISVSAVKINDKWNAFAIIRDITDKKIAEQKLKESEERYRLISEEANDMIALLNNKFEYEYINERVTYKYLGYKKDDLLGKSCLDFIHPDDVIKASKKLKKGYKTFGEDKVEIRFKHKKGYWVWLETRGKSFLNKKDKTKGLIISRVITERKIAEQLLLKSEEKLKNLNKELERKILERTKELRESEEKLRKQNIELKKLDELKNDFITIAAHELKTPLVPIMGFVELILVQDENLGPEIVDNLKKVQNNAERLRLYIDQLMDVMKIDADEIGLIRKKENISNLIKNCVDELKLEASNNNLQITLSIPDDLVLEYDPIRITQVFNNLLLNAIKFTPNSGVIKAYAEEKNDYYLFRIKDSGIGITKENIEHLFDKFARIHVEFEDLSKMEKGSGLGLYISKGIIEAHGGKIWVESSGKNQGSEFFFTLPKM